MRGGLQEKTFKKRCPRCPGVPIINTTLIYYNINNNIIINIIHLFHDFFNLNLFFLFSNIFINTIINIIIKKIELKNIHILYITNI